MDTQDQSFAPSVVTDTPSIQKGMRCALYVIRRDTTLGTSGPASWPDWTDQIASGYSLVWWGTVNGVTSNGPIFTIDCDGPSSWLRKALNNNAPEQWGEVNARLHLNTDEGAREDLIAVGYQYINPFDLNLWQRCGYSLFDPVADALTNDQNPGPLRFQIYGRLTTLAGTAGPDATFSTFQNGAVIYDDAGLRIRVDDGVEYGGVLHLCMHRRVWLFLGWDPEVQNRAYDEIETPRDVHFIKIEDSLQFWNGASSAPPGPGYYVGYFNTLPPGLNYQSAGIDVDNNGLYRTYLPLSDSGATILNAGGQQEIGVGFTIPGIYCEGQLARPVADHTMLNGLPCDRTGFMVLRGQVRESIDAEPHEVYAVPKVSWPDNGDNTGLSDDGTGQATVWIEKWLDPRRWGYREGPMTLDWSSNRVEWTTAVMLGSSTNALDYAHAVMLRIMLSTGTKTWSPGSYEDVDGAAYVVGTNAHPDAVAPHLDADDHEIADLGLAIPAMLIDWRSFVAAADDLPGGYKSPLNQIKLVKHGSFDAQDTLGNLMKPRAFYMGLHGYRYSLFNFSRALESDDAIMTITEADLDSDAQPFVPDVNLLPFQGFDKLEIEYHYPAAGEGGEPATLEARPLTARARARNGNAVESMSGEGMLDPVVWAGLQDVVPPANWQSDWRAVWQRDLADYLLQPHEMLLGVPVKIPKANDLNPGTVVIYNGPWPATRRGRYGHTAAVARVMSVSRDRDTLTATVDLLVQAGDPNTKRRFAPIARVVDDVESLEARHDEHHCTFYCYGDAWGHDGGSDVRYFAEPSWSQVGGNALVRGYQYDGRSWTQNFSFLVESVDTTAHTITYVENSFAGTFREREYTALMLAPYEDQTADWCRALFVVNTDETGKFGGVPGFKFV
jgi:hypothetical protein